MKFCNVRLLVKDYRKMFEFYTEKLGFKARFDMEPYASFEVAEEFGGEALALFTSDAMAQFIGNAEKKQPVGQREKSMISFETENVDETYKALLAKGVEFINQPTDWTDACMRVVHLYDPEENLIELYSPLETE
ncbi:MAG: VOC family protein [Bacteroidales bacterium]|nr:VOC family protein [Bacteroidales bacterium]